MNSRPATSRALPLPAFARAFHLRPSALRGSLIVVVSLAAAFLLADYPHNRATLWLIFPAAIAVIGTIDTARCMRPVWDLYHGAVLLCLYMEMFALTMIVFLLLWPYMRWFL